VLGRHDETARAGRPPRRVDRAGRLVDRMTKPHTPFVLCFLLSIGSILLVDAGHAAAQAHKPPKPPKSVRLYIFDCGVIHTTNGDTYSLKKEEMASTEMSIPCILVAHPKGTLMW